MNFSNNLKTLMKEKGMRQQDVARASGLSAATMTGYCRDKIDPRLSGIAAAARALDVPPAALLADDAATRALIIALEGHPDLSAALVRLIQAGPEQLSGAAAVIEVLQAVQAGE